MTGLMTACNAPDEQVWATVFEELSFAALPEPALTLLTEEAEDTVFQLRRTKIVCLCLHASATRIMNMTCTSV